ncbi:uncharacterized protein LOC144201540 isoform X2 [Stigmatopora nigra]
MNHCFESTHIKSVSQSSFIYSLNLRYKMKTRRCSGVEKVSKKQIDQSPSTNEGTITRKIRSKRRRRFFDTNQTQKDGNVYDLIDIINSHVVEQPEEEDNDIQLLDRRLDVSAEPCTSSTIDNPSKVTAPNKNQRRKRPCLSCRRLYQKAKRLKTPIKDKLLDNDPTSLTCDHWVLLKKWMPTRLPYLRGNLAHTLQRLHTHVKRSTKAKQKNLEKSNKDLCSRPHILLQRNLRQCCKVLAKKEPNRNQKKRPRNDSCGSRITGKKRHLSSSPPQDENENWSSQSSFHSTCDDLAVEDLNVEKSIAENKKKFTTKIKPKLFPQNSKRGGKAPKLKGPKKKTPAQNVKFQNMITQLRGNSSIIVKETH